mgnify:CR=1 FL=1
MLNLLAHSLMMFYLIGKGKAIREAVTESALEGLGLSPGHLVWISRSRVP